MRGRRWGECGGIGRIGVYWVIRKLARGIEADFIAAVNHFLGTFSPSSYRLNGHQIGPLVPSLVRRVTWMSRNALPPKPMTVFELNVPYTVSCLAPMNL